MNPYDPCVANKMVNGKQFTVVWHVDDLKVSHADSNEVTKFIDWIKSKYEDAEIGRVTISRGKKHKYLGMMLDYSKKGCVSIDMKKYVEDMIDAFPEEITSTAATPAANHLFFVRDNAKKLNDEQASTFHTIVAKGLFLCKRARPDIQTTIVFLSTRVKEPDEDDWKKLRHLILYLNGTKDLVHTLSADHACILKWYIDAAYAVHPDMHSHSGSTLTLGKGSVYSGSHKQKLNVRSSTEAELVATDDYMSQILWTNYFLDAQGFKTKDTIIYQDNKSAILLEKNGKSSSSKRTKHINVRYFFITDRIKNKEVKVEFCPTDEMVADFFTKSLQGSKSIQFRKFIMNLD